MGRHLTEGAGTALSQRLARIGLHDHACLVLDPQDQRLEIASAFLRIGLERGERCVYVADENTAGRVLPLLREAGSDPGRALASRALVITTDGGTCLRSGAFDPGELFASLESQIEAALADGFRALRLVCEATWALGRSTTLERLAAYEERLKRTFRDRPIVALWLYDPWRCSSALVGSFLRMHPLVVARGEVHRNCLFVPAVRRVEGRQRQEDWQATIDAVVERSRAEEAAARRMEQLHASLEGGAHALWTWDLESDRITLEPHFAEVPGIERSRLAVTLAEWEQVVHPDGLAALWRGARDHVEGRAPRLDHECRMRDRAGGWRWVQLRARVVGRDRSGRPVRIAGTATDVTELRAARDRLLSQEQLGAAAEQLSASIAEVVPTVLALRRRVLIIDDEEPRAGSFARILQNDHEVTALASAQEALRRIEAGESWDVILCDLQTRELDGMEFYERLNRSRPDLAARLGFITEGPWPPEVRTFLACNTWPTIEKPVDPDGVRAIVARMAPQ